MFTKRNLSMSMAALMLLLMVGCQSAMSPSPTADSMAVPQKAVVVVTGNGGAVTVFVPSADTANPVMLSTSGGEACPDCKAAAAKYFQTGVLDPKCAKCGGTRTATVLVTPNVGHQ